MEETMASFRDLADVGDRAAGAALKVAPSIIRDARAIADRANAILKSGQPSSKDDLWELMKQITATWAAWSAIVEEINVNGLHATLKQKLDPVHSSSKQ
jgi:hypothetical protein